MENKDETKIEDEAKLKNLDTLGFGILLSVILGSLTHSYPPVPPTIINIYSDKKMEVAND